MRELHEIDPVPTTIEDVLRNGLSEIALMAPGNHDLPCYGDKRRIKDYAARILQAAAALSADPPADPQP